MIKIEIKAGEEIIESLTKQLAEKGIKDAAIVSVIGALDSFCLSTMPKDDGKKVIENEYHEPVELTGTGEVEDGIPHLHVTVGRADATALMGHLEWGKIKDWFVNIYIIPLT